MAINRKGTITASTQRACVGSLAAHLDKFAEFLVGEGYVSETIKAKYALVADLSHWLKHVECRWQNSTRRGSSSFTPTVVVQGDAAMYLPAISC